MEDDCLLLLKQPLYVGTQNLSLNLKRNSCQFNLSMPEITLVFEMIETFHASLRFVN